MCAKGARLTDRRSALRRSRPIFSSACAPHAGLTRGSRLPRSGAQSQPSPHCSPPCLGHWPWSVV
eukprot:5001707-Prymnesium_polylepis.1